MTQRTFLVLALVGFLAAAWSSADQRRPNIVFILADDLGYAQLGCFGSDYYQTPRIDRLASEGMKFSNAYAAAAICSPTRASIMTGKYPTRLHLTDFIAGNQRDEYKLRQPDWQKALPLEEATIGELLKEGGYKTALFGKWHLSAEKKGPGSYALNPDKQGFDETFVTWKPSDDLKEEWQDAENDPHNVAQTYRAGFGFSRSKTRAAFFPDGVAQYHP